LRLSGIALAVAFLESADLESADMLSQGVAHQSGTIPLRLARYPVGCLQQLFIEHNLNRFHMWTSSHSIVNNAIIRFGYPHPQLSGLRPEGHLYREIFPRVPYKKEMEK